jgi:hypothetical protein
MTTLLTRLLRRIRPPAAPAIDVVAQIKALRLNDGPLAGAYPIAPAGKVNWYFANLGLMGIVNKLSADDGDFYIRQYLDAFVRHVDGDGIIFDYGPNGPEFPDSHDSYAATFLTLVLAYETHSGNSVWANSNMATLKLMAYNCLTTQVKSNMLTSVFRNGVPSNIGYLMDNCEVYRGLRDFAALLRKRGDTDADYYDSFATQIPLGMRALFSVAYKPSDAHQSPETTFYPGTTCQVFPQAFGVPELSNTFDTAYFYLNNHSPGWEKGTYDMFPWAVLGYVAAVRNDAQRARTQLATMNTLFQSNRALVTINELGWYQRTTDLLK